MLTEDSHQDEGPSFFQVRTALVNVFFKWLRVKRLALLVAFTPNEIFKHLPQV